MQLLITQPQAQCYGRGRAERRNGTGGEKKEHKTVKVIFKNYFILYLSIITHIHTYTVFVLVSRRMCTMYRIQGASHQLSHSLIRKASAQSWEDVRRLGALVPSPSLCTESQECIQLWPKPMEEEMFCQAQGHAPRQRVFTSSS